MVGEVFYQVGVIDAAGRNVTEDVESLLRAAVDARGLDSSQTLRFFSGTDARWMRDIAPRITVYFGGPNYDPVFNDTVDAIVKSGDAVIPVVPTLIGFHQQVPSSLLSINGMEIPIGHSLDALISLVLESLRLLRSKRRIFVSYRRVEAQNAATQLYHELDARSFDPFLDTHSIRSGDPFQERLWHRMADCDLVVLLYTPDVLSSEWVVEEIDRVSAMGITVLQLIWPDVARHRTTDLFEPLYLQTTDFQPRVNPEADPLLTSTAVEKIALSVERLRARAQAAREARLMKVLCGLANEQKIPFVTRLPGCVDFCVAKEKFTRVYLGIGVPDGPTYHEAVHPPPDPLPGHTVLMYDPLAIAPFHQLYLDWLGPLLPVETLTPAGAEAWLKNLESE